MFPKNHREIRNFSFEFEFVYYTVKLDEKKNNAHEEGSATALLKQGFVTIYLLFPFLSQAFLFAGKKQQLPLIQYVSYTFADADAECLPQLQERKMYYKNSCF